MKNPYVRGIIVVLAMICAFVFSVLLYRGGDALVEAVGYTLTTPGMIGLGFMIALVGVCLWGVVLAWGLMGWSDPGDDLSGTLRVKVNALTCVYVDDHNEIATSTDGFPASCRVKLATVWADKNSVVVICEDRQPIGNDPRVPEITGLAHDWRVVGMLHTSDAIRYRCSTCGRVADLPAWRSKIKDPQNRNMLALDCPNGKPPQIRLEDGTVVR